MRRSLVAAAVGDNTVVAVKVYALGANNNNNNTCMDILISISQSI